MDQSINQMGQDLALAKYAKSTRSKYLRTAEHLANRFGRRLADLTREELRTYVEEITARGKSASWMTGQMCALSFLYRKTLGQPERVSFLTFPKQKRPLPTVLSLEEVGGLLAAIRVPRYQAIAMVLYGHRDARARRVSPSLRAARPARWLAQDPSRRPLRSRVRRPTRTRTRAPRRRSAQPTAAQLARTPRPPHRPRYRRLSTVRRTTLHRRCPTLP